VLSKIGDKIDSIEGDIRDRTALHDAFVKSEPDIVFHLAAQPLVRLSYKLPYETYDTNVMGTLNVLEEIRKGSAKVGVMITTDKCYENKETLTGYKETDPMGGYDPYSSSKACAEILISSYRNSFLNPNEFEKHGKGIASVRAGNVIGGGDWADDRIIPDCIRALEKGKPIKVHNPAAVRPWQHVLEPLCGYLTLGYRLFDHPTKYCEGFNFGPDSDGVVTVKEIAETVVKYYGSGEVKIENEKNAVHEAKLLTLNIDKAKERLQFRPRLSVDEAIKFTVDWYKNYQSEEVYNLCTKQIKEYLSR
jgi:CDP-glucose 4,6-dehydratase